MTARGRELSDNAIRAQAAARASYISRGGLGSAWLRSKDFTPADRRAILLACSDLDREAAS